MPKKYYVGNVKEEHEHPYLPVIHSLKSFSEIKGPIQKILLREIHAFLCIQRGEDIYI